MMFLFVGIPTIFSYQASDRPEIQTITYSSLECLMGYARQKHHIVSGLACVVWLSQNPIHHVSF